ncbi:MAG: J domain-containing protein [Novosphingobium sp.]|nr:J domain-containing protein [Novosphingobium sp.]
MIKFLWLLVLASIACRMLAGRWPWQFLAAWNRAQTRHQRARNLLGVKTDATRQDILEAHRRLLATVHPDKGGSEAGVHEANDARDLLLHDLESRSNSQ